MFHPIRVLVLEDYEDDCILMLRELRRGGFEPSHLIVETASAMETALERDEWDIILSDYSMPDFSAPAALKVLKKSNKNIPFIVVSGNVGEVIAVQLMQHGAADYINKDNLSRLCPAIQRELNESKLKKQRKESETITNRLWDIFNHSLNEIYLFDATTFEFIAVNEGALHNLGYTMDEMKCKHPWDIKPDLTGPEFRNKISSLINDSQKSLHFETFHLRKNGTTYPVEVRLQLSTEENIIFYAIVLDITERKKDMEKIEILARFPEENPQPVLRINYRYEVLYNNPSSNQLVTTWGESRTKIIPDTWRKIVDLCGTTLSYQLFEDKINQQIYSWLLFPSKTGEYINCYGHDITTQKESENVLRQSYQVFENISEGIMICDKDDVVTAINPAFTKITGFTENEIVRKNAAILNSEIMGDTFIKKGKPVLLSTGIWKGEYSFKNSKGNNIPVNLSVSTIRNRNNINSFIYVVSDFSERKLAQQHIHNLSYFDPLTNLPNRLHIHEKLFDLLGEAHQFSHCISIIYLDINRFKTINESLGHQTADKALALVANRLSSIIPENAFLGRMGADEFIIVIDDSELTSEESAVIDSISQAFKESFELQGQETYINVTLGISHYPENGLSADELIKHAESAVVHAKRKGKYLEIYSNELHTRNKEHIRLETDLRKALEKNEYVLYYQPKIDLKTRKIVGLEALIRWHRPEIGLIPPGEFIPLLEETGLIVQVGDWVIKEACRQLKEWEHDGIPQVNISVNLSGKQFNQEHLVENILKILSDSNVAPQMIELEVTESTIMHQYDRVIKILNELHDHKFVISIDDFGTGYSSLAYLKHFPIDVLKVDRSFVMEIPNDKDDTAIVNTIISMGHNLNLKVVAEGVETIEQMNTLNDMGCELAQGFYFGKALPAHEVAELLRKQ
ncbi:MAG: EAL domain-containing protein [Gammaproteobacteria bacterium]|nr:EAL domain-containing protein [Gammaproteobacteria bacterium]